MKVVSSIAELQHLLGSFDKEQIALVPTMGCLHEGHVSLIEKAKRLADVVVVSIYVNPLQFSKGEDLDVYPRPFEQDINTCKDAGADIVFHPDNLYPEQGIQVGLHVNALSHRLCGASRPGHFDGVVTVVNILFNIIRPHLAIFGEKDFQQLSIIRRMVSDLHMSVEVIGAPTIRELDGLAKSSRNKYLSDDEKLQAAEISTMLHLMQAQAKSGGTLQCILETGHQHLEKFDIQVEYLEICDEASLEPLLTISPNQAARILIAARVGATRLIDNMPLWVSNEERSCN